MLDKSRSVSNETKFELNESKSVLNESKFQLNESKSVLNESKFELNESRSCSTGDSTPGPNGNSRGPQVLTRRVVVMH